MNKLKTSILIHSFLFILIAMAFSQCKAQKSNGQGVMGKVTWLEGNQMPTIKSEEELKDEPVNPKGMPVKRTLKIYPLTNMMDAKQEDGLYTSVKGEPVASVETDENGNYSIELSPGNYSIFTVEENGLFANTFDGQGNIQPVTVKKGEWTEKDIVINYKAYF